MSVADHLRARIARRLERGDPSRIARAASAAWAAIAARRVARPIHLPDSARVIGVGSAVIGGAGKTPLAIALARDFADRGERVALVGHAYRASPGRARLVDPADRVDVAGDDALSAARILADTAARVIVAPTRQAAVDLAADLGSRVIVIDGLIQSAPRRLADAILVLDADAPWGASSCPPAGDLRAPREALLAAADHLAVITAAEIPAGLPDTAIAIPSAVSSAVSAAGERIALASLAAERVGLLVTVARPDRIAAALRRAGIVADPLISLADHASPSPEDLARAACAGVACWITTARCAVKLPAAIGGAPVLALDHRLSIGALARRLSVR